MSYQKLTLLGNVTEPEIKDVNGVKVATFRLAASEKYVDRNGEPHENTEWFSIVCWRKQAELIEKYVHKGDQVFIEGKLKTRKYTTRDGDERSVTDVIPDVIKFAGGKKEYKSNDAPSQDSPQDTPQDGQDDLPF